MNGAVWLIALLLVTMAIVIAWTLASRVIAGKKFFKELQTAYQNNEISKQDYRRISELFIFTDGFSHTLESNLRSQLKNAKKGKNYPERREI